MEFDDFILRIGSTQDGLSLTGFYQGNFYEAEAENPFTNDTIELIQSRVESAAKSVGAKTRRALGDNEADELLRKKGRELHDALLIGEVRDGFLQACAESAKENRSLRIRLHPDEELAAYPFEILWCDKPFSNYAALNAKLAIVRSPKLLSPTPDPIEPPMKILLVGADPIGQVKLAVSEELESLRDQLEIPGVIEVLSIQGRDTIRKLNEKSEQGASFHVIHVVCHGMVKDGRGVLLFEGPNGDTDEVSGQDFVSAIGAISDIRLVVVNACLGSSGDFRDPLASVATSVFSHGIPAVVAMQYEITDDAAVEFAKDYYGRLSRGQPVDRAMTFSRQALRRLGAPSSPEWVTPRLYLACRDGDLLGLEVETTQLLEETDRCLEAGKWHEARRHVSLVGSDDREIEARRALAETGERFQQTWEEFHEVLSAGSIEYVEPTLRDLTKASKEFSEQLSSRTESGDTGNVRAFRDAARAVIQRESGSYDAADELLNGVEGGLLAVDFIRDRFQREHDAKAALDESLRCWQQADWRGAKASLLRLKDASDSMLAEDERETLSTLKKILPMVTPFHTQLELSRNRSGEDLVEFAKNLKVVAEHHEIPLAEELARFATDAAALLSDRSLSPEESQRRLDEILKSTLPGSTAAPLVVVIRDIAYSTLEKRDSLNAYEAALSFFLRESFDEALTKLQSATDPKSRELAKVCGVWSRAKEHILREEWGEAAKCLRSLRNNTVEVRGGRAPDINLWLSWCRRGPRVLAALERMSSCELLHFNEDSAYGTVAEFGVHPTSTMAACIDVGFELQQRGLDAAERARYWDPIRTIERRLEVDFYLFKVESPEQIRSLLDELRTLSGGIASTTLNRIAEVLGDDLGVFKAVMGSYESAIDIFENRVKADPSDSVALHHLGLAAWGHLLQIETSDDEVALNSAWEWVVSAWSSVLADDEFWRSWWAKRVKYYGKQVPESEIAEVRAKLAEALKERIQTTVGSGYVWQACLLELHASRAVRAGGGIPGQVTGKSCVLGPMAVQKFGLVDPVDRWLDTLECADDDCDEWQWRVRLYFSELGIAALLTDVGAFDEAIELLQSLETIKKIEKMKGWYRRQRVLLLAEAHFQKGEYAVRHDPVDVTDALDSWDRSVEHAKTVDKESAFVAQIAEQLIIRAKHWEQKSLEDSNVHDFEALLKLLDLAVSQRGWNTPDRSLTHSLATSYQNLAMFISVEGGDEKTALDLARRAYRVEPKSLRSICVVAVAAVKCAFRLRVIGADALATAVLNEADNYLEEGRRYFPDHPSIESCQEMRDAFEENVAAGSSDALQRAVQAFNVSAPTQNETDDFVEAMVLESQGQYGAAVAGYWALRDGPRKREALQKLANCYRLWLSHSIGNDGLSRARVREILAEARDRCGDSVRIDSEIYAYIEQGEDHGPSAR